MEFRIRKPCEHCPFRRHCPPFWRRADEIAKKLLDDHEWFACHNTTGRANGRGKKKAEWSQCAGSMIVLEREGRPNIAMRLAYRFGMLKPFNLSKFPYVFNSLQEMVEHHKKG